MLQGATIVDVTNGKLSPEQTVVIVGNRIHMIGPTKKVRLPPGAQLVDARGKYLIPGLWDMHTHVDDDTTMYARFIAHGVTGIREMAQRFENGIDSFVVWQREVAAGTRLGPRSIGPSVDLTLSQRGDSIVIASSEDVSRVFDSLKTAGITFLKWHGADADYSLDLFFTMLREARRIGLPFVGHTPFWRAKVTSVDIADSGMSSIEHFNSHNPCFPAMMLAEDSASINDKCGSAATAYIRNGTWITPTLGFSYRMSYAWKQALAFVRLMHGAGVKTFLAGSDGVASNGRYLKAQRVPPGFSLLQEVVFLNMAGLTPLEALQAATLNPAKFLNATDSLGTVAQGKLADLVLLDANPLEDIRHIMRTSAVVANGRYLDHMALDGLDPQRTSKAQSFAVEWPTEAGQRSHTP